MKRQSILAFLLSALVLLGARADDLGKKLIQMNPKVTPGERKAGADIAVVPLAVPVIIGPATCGPLLVMGADLGDWGSRLVAMLAMNMGEYTMFSLSYTGAVIWAVVIAGCVMDSQRYKLTQIQKFEKMQQDMAFQQQMAMMVRG